MLNKTSAFIVSFMLSAVLSVLIFLFFCWFFMTVFPPYSGVGHHPVMPIGQAIGSLAISLISGPILLFLLYKRLTKKQHSIPPE